MADQSTQPTWDAVVLAGQLHTIAKQSQSLMRRFAASQADATKMGMGDTSTLGFDFVDLMTKMMSDPTPVANAQIDLFNDSVALWQKAAERMWMIRPSEPERPNDKRFKHQTGARTRSSTTSRKAISSPLSRFFRPSGTSKAWTRPQPARSISTRASLSMPFLPRTSSQPTRRS